MKILFAAPENAWGGVLVLLRKALPEHEFVALGNYAPEGLGGYDVMIPTMSRITEPLLDTADRLRLIQQVGSGLEGVDIAAARKRGIQVANVPTDACGNADSVAELGIYLMIGLTRDFRGMATSFAHRKIGEPRGTTLMGKTIGIVGLGGIGKALVKRLQSFDVRLIGIKRDNPQKAEKELGLHWVGGSKDLEKLLGLSDFVILCLPVTAESRDLLNERTFAAMKKGSYLINLSRGGLVNRDALEKALASGQIAGAGLDVFWEEPVDPSDPIFRHNILVTPHIGGSTDVSITGIAKIVADNIHRVELGQQPLYVK
ncbi:MAG TPA: 2-hydroxyacid dehydrogenase [Syntrophales bacterium]|nr:2-hydroxyacid dehydrogenase [Syntrophales bacterium]